ncbi:glycoside hydrolase superfamily [Gorgonomyces haynaldii]|nr:glycoside hydrolase superfamily [Gorgonomyces haynaldii]
MLFPVVQAGSITYSPYVQAWADHSQLMTQMSEFSVNSINLAFAIARLDYPSQCNPNVKVHEPVSLAWNGDEGMDLGPLIKSLQSKGYQVTASFGGAASEQLFPKGVEIAGMVYDWNVLANMYLSFIDQYNITSVDFDIEEGARLTDIKTTKRRNGAIRIMQQKRRSLKVSYTIPVGLSGLEKTALDLLKDAASKKLVLSSVNLMLMNFGYSVGLVNGNMGDTCIKAAQNAYTQIKAFYPNIKIGLVPMIGVNDVSTNVFQLTDAQKLKSFAVKQSWVNFVSFWSIERDRPQGSAFVKQAGCAVLRNKASATNSGTNNVPGAYTKALNPAL